MVDPTYDSQTSADGDEPTTLGLGRVREKAFERWMYGVCCMQARERTDGKREENSNPCVACPPICMHAHADVGRQSGTMPLPVRTSTTNDRNRLIH